VSDVELLIVEDNPNDATLMLRTLASHNFANKIKVVEDGQEALDYLFSPLDNPESPHNLRVVFLDLKLPKVSGLEVLAAIKSCDKTRSLPVVIVTSSQEEPDLKRCYELGVNSYVVKPVGFEQFARAIADLGLYWLALNKVPGQAN
jgi:two-component system, response regulator